MMNSNSESQGQPKTTDEKLDKLEEKLSKAEITSHQIGWLTSIFGFVITCLGAFQSFQIGELQSQFEEEKHFADSLLSSIQHMQDGKSGPLAIIALSTITDNDEEDKVLFSFIVSAAQSDSILLESLVAQCEYLLLPVFGSLEEQQFTKANLVNNQTNDDGEISEQTASDQNSVSNLCQILKNQVKGAESTVAPEQFAKATEKLLKSNEDEESGVPNLTANLYAQSQQVAAAAAPDEPPDLPVQEEEQLWMYLARKNPDGKIADALITVEEESGSIKRGDTYNVANIASKTFIANTNVNLRVGAGTDNEVVTVLKKGQCIKVGSDGTNDIEEVSLKVVSESSGKGTSRAPGSEPPKGIWVRVEPLERCP
jgi:hypothetical protein